MIEEQSIASSARKTNIAELVVRKLFDKEFETMKLPQAMGAIRIIEREYRVNLDDLRQECIVYFDEHTSTEIGLVNVSQIKKKKTIFPKLFTVVLLILFVYSAWYFFTGYYKQKVSPLDPQSTISLIGTLLGKEDTISEQPVVKKSLEEIKILERIEVPERIEIQDSIAGEVVVVEPKESIVESTYENVVVDNLDDNSDIVEAMSMEVVSTETLVVEQNESSQQVAEESVLESNLSESNASTLETPAVAIQESVVLLPQREMWFRLTNEKSKEKRQFRRKYRYKIDLKKNNWLFATENALFAFMNNDFFEEFGGAGKLFFRLDQQGVHQLSEDEYRAACK